jgi:ABC-2 type transport system ATP-binding protein
MIELDRVEMQFPMPRRYLDILRRPFAAPRYVPVLDRISLTIGSGEQVAVFGPNGAGKTTLLKLMAGILYPTHGSVRINGLDTTVRNLDARKNVAFVTNEDRSFYWRLTGAQNLRFFGTLNNLFGRELNERISLVMEQVGLNAVGDTRVSDYSSGMRQRLAIARALLADPRFLLLDEPTRSLDISGAKDIRDLLRTHSQGHPARTMVVMTNNPEDAVALCGKLHILHKRSMVSEMEVSTLDSAQLEAFYRRATGSMTAGP